MVLSEVLSQVTAEKRHRFLRQRLEWPTTASHPHEGMPLGNGLFGALIWPQGSCLRITIARADYWDNRGGLQWSEEATYANLRRWLTEGNEARLREVFEGRTPDGARPDRPTHVPVGRVELDLPGPLTGAGLWMARGEAVLEYQPVGSVRAILLRDEAVLALRAVRRLRAEGGGAPAAAGAAGMRVRGVPPQAPEVVEWFRKRGYPDPVFFAEDDVEGWVQPRPVKPLVCVAWTQRVTGAAADLFLTAAFGSSAAQARANACATLTRAAAKGYDALAAETAAWWEEWWAQTAVVELPDADKELLYCLGVYKLAGLSVSPGPPASLQGPWLEDHRMPPWGSDFHFNVNVQECYWAAFGANHPETLLPLVTMLRSWEPRLREQARIFVGVADGLLLPHAVDNQCNMLGGFWSGAVDHGCAAWTAHLLWLYYRHTMDQRFLRETAYPFMRGALRTYEAMLEEREGAVGARHALPLRLPVGVSPEFRGNSMDAWGANASFQLALIHFLCRAVVEASEILGEDEQQRSHWRDIETRLPVGAIGGEPGREELLLWEGQPLTESHRHHSHLMGIHPLDTLDYGPGGEHEGLVRRSIDRWVRQGMGLWCAWCTPWAAMIHARMGHGEMADLMLDILRRAYMGAGYQTALDPLVPGVTVLAHFSGKPCDIMQIDACMGACAAVLEMLVQHRSGVLYLFPAVPSSWKEVSFRGVRVEGAFLVSAQRQGCCAVRVELYSEAGSRLRLRNPFGELPRPPKAGKPQACSPPASGAPAILRRGDGSETVLREDIIETETRPGETLVLTPQAAFARR